MQALFDRIRELPNKDLESLFEFVRAERAKRNAGKRSDAPDKAREYLFDEIGKAIRNERPSERVVPVYQFQRDKGNNTVLNNACFRLIELENGICKLEIAERKKLYNTLSRLAVQRLAHYKDDLHPRYVLQEIADNASGLLNGAFPGYGTTEFGWKLLFKKRGSK